MSIKTSIITLLLLGALLLTGCCVHYGTDRRASQATEDTIRTDDERQDSTSQAARLREDLRAANERARLAEEKAESERQKRESAEERLKQLEERDQGKESDDSAEDKATGGS